MFKEKIEKIGIIFSVIGVIVTFVLSLLSLNIASESLSVSNSAYEDNRKINQLDLKPEINFILNFDTNPYFTITNTGPIEIIDGSIQLISYFYNEKSSSVEFINNIGNIAENFYVGKLNTLESKKYEIKPEILKYYKLINIPSFGQFYQNKNILEVRIKYRKNPDKELFIKRAFYFLDSNNIWTNESDLFFQQNRISEYENKLEWVKNNKASYLDWNFSNKLYDYYE